jgi:hypothetical protein
MDNKEQREYYTEKTAAIDRICPYDSAVSSNSIGATAVLSYGSEDCAKVDNPCGTASHRYTRILRDIKKSIDQRSKRYRE